MPSQLGRLAGAARRLDVSLHRLDPPVVHLVGLLRALARAAGALGVAVDRHLVAGLGDVAVGRGRLPAAGLSRGRPARAAARRGPARGAARPRVRPAPARARGAAVDAVDRPARPAPAAAPSTLRVGGRLGQDEQQGQGHGRARAPRREPTIPGLHHRPPFGAVSGGAGSPASGRFIAFASIFCAPSGASKVKSPSGTGVSSVQRRMTALYCGSPGSCT